MEGCRRGRPEAEAEPVVIEAEVVEDEPAMLAESDAAPAEPAAD